MSKVLRRLVRWLTRLPRRIELFFTGDWTWCDGCKKFSPGDVCPYCPRHE